MADFVAILSKTIDGLGERNTAEMRERVYGRARKAIEDKLAAITPAPSKAQTDRQYKLLDDAILELETRYAPPIPKPAVNPELKPSVPSDPLADFLASADEVLAAPSPTVAVPKAAEAFRRDTLPPFPGTVKPSPASIENASQLPGNAGTKAEEPSIGMGSADQIDMAPSKKAMARETSGGGTKGAIYALLGLLLIGGAGYAGYVYKDQIMGVAQTVVAPAETPPAGTETATPATETASPPPGQGSAQPTPAETTPPKMTQRLTPEGQEVDAGPSTAPEDVGEGTTVAEATVPSQPAGSEQTGQTTEQAVAVGQKAIFYEEKTGTEQGTADQGNIVWSVVQDSPGLDQPPEPAIRGELTIPGKGLSVRMTIKRNLDKSLPASHIVEMLFVTPPDFAGGAVENVSRFSMKDTEQAPGNPLVGVPASFGDGFFLIALTDEKTAIDTNMQLLERQEWIDIPVAYRSGRRALLSFEKGLSGDKVFKEVIAAWNAAGGATAPADTPPAEAPPAEAPPANGG